MSRDGLTLLNVAHMHLQSMQTERDYEEPFLQLSEWQLLCGGLLEVEAFTKLLHTLMWESHHVSQSPKNFDAR